jgi:hypothetical protein
MRKPINYKRQFIAFVIVFLIYALIHYSTTESDEIIAKREKENSEQQAKRQAMEKIEEENNRVLKNIESERILNDLGPLRCTLNIRWTVTKAGHELGEYLRKYVPITTDETPQYLEVSLFSVLKGKNFLYKTSPNYSSYSSVEESREDESFRGNDYVVVRPLANKCLTEFFSGKRSAFIGNSNVSINY